MSKIKNVSFHFLVNVSQIALVDTGGALGTVAQSRFRA